MSQYNDIHSTFETLLKIKNKIDKKHFDFLSEELLSLFEEFYEFYLEKKYFSQKNIINIQPEITIHREFKGFYDSDPEVPFLIPIKGCSCNREQICFKSEPNELLKCKNFKKFIEINPILKNFFVKNKSFIYSKITICDINNTPNFIDKNLNCLINLHQLQVQQSNMHIFNHHRLIILIAICDFLMTNFYFSRICTEYYIFALSELNKILNQQDNESYNNDLQFMLKYNINPTFWLANFTKIIAAQIK